MVRIVLLVMALALSACASASKPGAMVPLVNEKTVIAENSLLRNAITVTEVTGGKRTNPLWKSDVSSEDFTEALRQTLAAHAMLAPEQGRYSLEAELIKLKQPMFGIDAKVTSTVKYRLVDTATAAPVMEKIIENAYTASFSDAFVGVERLRLANEGSIKGNISQLMDALVTALAAYSPPVEAAQQAESSPAAEPSATPAGP